MADAKQNDRTSSVLPPRLVSSTIFLVEILVLFVAFAACAGVVYVHIRQENLNTELSKLRNRFEQLQEKVSPDSGKQRVEDIGTKMEKVVSKQSSSGR